MIKGEGNLENDEEATRVKFEAHKCQYKREDRYIPTLRDSSQTAGKMLK